MIQLTFPENVEVKTLIDYVSKRLGMNILYDASVVGKRMTIVSPTKIPRDSLLGLLQSVLKMSGLAMVEGDQPGWKKVVVAQNLLAVSSAVRSDGEALDSSQASVPVTQVFSLRSGAAAAVEGVVKGLLSQPGGNSFTVAERNLLIVSDFAGNLRRIAPLVEMLDAPGAKTRIRFVPARNLEAAELARQASALLAEKDRLAASGRPARVTLTPDPRGNQVVVISVEGEEAEALKLLEALDVPTSALTRTYRLRHVSPQRVDKLAQDYVGAESHKQQYKSAVDAETGLLVVTAPAAVHQYVEDLLRDLDVPPDADSSHVRFYKLLNATAATVLATIRSLESSEGGLTALQTQAVVPRPADADNRFTGPNRPPAAPGEEWPKPPSFRPSSAPADPPAASQPAGEPALTARTKDAVVTADPNTNTIIVIAPPAAQTVYRQLIEVLDRRRPQVMIEVTLVTLDTSGGYSMGVELSRKDQIGSNTDYLVFSSFGLSQVNPVSGALSLIPGTGFNGTLVGPDTVNAVIRALASNTRARVLSAPKVLVNDNATASLTSVAEAPFTSINASETVSTTSFAGYASAGTTVAVTPHISEGDHLQLQYAVTLNSFTGSGSGGIPPPRQTNALNSEVTVPDGHAVIVGGLTRRDVKHSVARVPVLGHIPLLEYLFSTRSDDDVESSLFVFIRPVILRDDQFEDLKYLTQRDLDRADLPPDMPAGRPLLME